ncbi:MAG: NfeD family protein [Pseudomonadota bacterium]
MSGASVAPYVAWLTVGVILCIAEMIVPGVFLMFMGLAALITGILTYLFPITIELQLLCFAVIAIASAYVGRRWFRPSAIVTDDPMLNDRLARLVGEIVTVSDPIVGGKGRAQVGDSVWSVRGPDSAKGSRMRVTGANGNTLIVEPQ